jgi:hypothetical protein
MINKIDSEIYKRLNQIHQSYNGVTGTNYNAIFSFVVYSGDIIQDEYGNYSPSESETITIKAKVRSTSPDKSLIDIGLSENRDYYQAWFVSPLTYQKEIPQVLDCQILLNGLWITGKFNVVRNNISNQLENTNIRKSLGYSIEGTFEYQSNQRA